MTRPCATRPHRGDCPAREEWWRAFLRENVCISFDLTNWQADQIQKQIEETLPLVVAEAENRLVQKIREEVEEMKHQPHIDNFRKLGHIVYHDCQYWKEALDSVLNIESLKIKE